MTTRKLLAIAALMAATNAAAAQQPPRSDSTRTVTLDLAAYNRLLDLASRPPERSPVPPVPAVLASAELRVRVERDTARGVFNLAGDVLRAGVSRVNLLTGATLVDGSAAGGPLPLLADGSSHVALLPGPGEFTLTLDWAAPLAYTPGRASFVLPVPPAGTARATIDVPGDQAEIHLSAGLVTKRSVADGRTVIDATLRPGVATEVWWSMRDSAPVAAAREARTLADIMTLVTLGDSDVRMAALIDVTVVQGEPRSLELRLPPDYELTGISGSSLESSDQTGRTVVLTLSNASLRRHQFLVALERPHAGGSFTLDTSFLTLPGVQRERGEVAVEGVGTLELSAGERDGMHRIDARELNRSLQQLSRVPVLAAFRYQRAAAAPPNLALDVKRFADAGVLAAVADTASATTLVTAEGRALTEVVLSVRNRAQPFLKVSLPAGATIVSVEVAGESAKPVLGPDGTRVPLLRPGFRPNGVYKVSFVYLHAGTPFARKGDMQMALPKMDMPIGLVEWELFAPENYSIRAFDGNVIDRQAIRRAANGTGAGGGRGSGRGPGLGGGTGGGSYQPGRTVGVEGGVIGGVAGGVVGGLAEAPPAAPVRVAPPLADAALPGQIRGRVTDVAKSGLPGVTVVVESGRSQWTAVTSEDGTYALSAIPSGTLTVTANLSGFTAQSRAFVFDQQPRQVDFSLSPGRTAETVTVTAEQSARNKVAEQKSNEPSQNVINLQRRAAGVLPVRVDVPRAGSSHQFVKPLVVDQETVVSLRYKRR
jgi:hypothetical protein